ncbi:hypothetical protein KUTeg_016848 [Tegillarca granosa]|uniref:Sulfatase-modifying factor enzyme-like domain-containing protein n=1 Tax=Tegillarca granosa TaxID=220873 RepID=A0ABQ9EM37_TEGGR|nr:hypothetical protein KUTeg_016848 [Tegillarca granosa]
MIMLLKVLTGELCFKSLRPPNLNECTKKQLQEYFENSYDLNESLFTAFKDDSVFYKCPDRLRLPLIFYFCHTACVYVNKLMLAGLIKERVNLEFETMFETGVDEMSWDDTENYRMGGSYNWPSLDEVVEYRRKVRSLILKVIQDTPLELPITMESPWVSGPVNKNPFIPVDGKKVTIGKPKDFPSYGWDNEYGEVNCSVPAFEATKYLITNRQFLEFVKAGGYENKTFWTEEAWQWKEFRQAKHPVFWICNKGMFNILYRAMFDVIDLPMDWPVDATYHEARAFCAWMGPDYRLPLEAEHNVMRGEQLPPSAGVKSDIIFQDKTENNINFVYGSSTPVNMFSPTSLGFHDVAGNIWEWTEDHFNGLSGFHTHWLYDDFSSPCFDGRHNLILGGSWISTGDEASRFARFAFRRHFIQHADNPFLLENEKLKAVKVPSTNTQYGFDSVQALEGILELEFGYRKSFPAVIAQLCKHYVQIFNCGLTSCVWLGSGVGRGPFEFTNVFQNMLAIDFGGRFIDTATKLQNGEIITFTNQNGEECTAGVDDNANVKSITFKQLTWLPNEVDSHDMVIVTFLERTQNPVGELSLKP